MGRYKVVDPVRFQKFKDMVTIAVWILLAVLFVMFIDAHDGLGAKEKSVTEYHTYEILYETSGENSRVKEPAMQKVVYRYFE